MSVLTSSYQVYNQGDSLWGLMKTPRSRSRYKLFLCYNFAVYKFTFSHPWRLDHYSVWGQCSFFKFSMRVARRTRVLGSNLQSRSGCMSSFKLDACVLPQTRHVWLRFWCCLLILAGAWICLDLVSQWWVLRVLLHIEELCALDSCWNALVLVALCLDEVYLLNSCPKTWFWLFAVWCELNISYVQVLTERFMPLDGILILSCSPGLVFQAQREGVSLASTKHARFQCTFRLLQMWRAPAWAKANLLSDIVEFMKYEYKIWSWCDQARISCGRPVHIYVDQWWKWL